VLYRCQKNIAVLKVTVLYTTGLLNTAVYIIWQRESVRALQMIRTVKFLQKLFTTDDVTKYRGIPVSRYFLRRCIIIGHFVITRTHSALTLSAGCMAVMRLQGSFFIFKTRQLLLLHPFNGLFSRTTWVSQHQKGKPF